MKNIAKFFGSTTVGKKGQVVIPMETRKKMVWQEGDKLLVFGLENGAVVLTKIDKFSLLVISLKESIRIL